MMLEDVAVLTPTRLETWAARRRLPRARVHRIGIEGSRGLPEPPGPAIVCGLAGGLDPSLEPGDVVIADAAALPGEDPIPTDPELTGRLEQAARCLGLRTARGPVLTAPHLVTGSARRQWPGFLAADMEVAHVLRRRPRTAAIRVVLDTGVRELSPDWERPALAGLRPRRWAELLRLAREAPGASLLAASVVRAALSPSPPRS
jgi:hypothetical protein